MATRALSRVAGVLALLKRLALEPALIGPVLLALTKGPVELRQRLFDYVPSLRNDRNLRVLLRTLKFLLGLGLASRINAALNFWAMNHFHWRKPGVKWDFENQTEIAVVTGGCSGFGHLITMGLAGKMKVVVVDIQDLPKDLEGRYGVSFYRCDLASPNAVRETAAAIRREVGAPTILINNAGIGAGHTIMDTSDEWLEKIFRVNLLSHYALIQEFLPGMLEQRKGHIVSIASMASYVCPAGLVDYSCTKAGVLALHEGLNQELRTRYGPNGTCIQTTIVHPEWARTPLVRDWEAMLDAAKIPVMPASVVSDAVVGQVLSGRSGHIYCPDSARMWAGLRGWPSWLQDSVRSEVSQLGRKH